jgi:uncharacterized protein YodC (DUF2158 family)
MTFEPGDVVILKSGGQSMTVAAIASDDTVECIWLGDEGDLFRQAIPAVALTSVADDTDDD